MQSTRHRNILEVLRVDGEISLTDLAERLGVSSETVRRDIKKLADDGVVQAIRGGVALPEVLKETAFHYCMLELVEEKRVIAALAAQQVASGDSLIILGGSTAAYFAWELRRFRDLTVVTNSGDIARLLVTRSGNKVFMIGGLLRADNGSTYGALAAEALGQFAVSSVFFSSLVHPVDGFMHDQSEDVLMIRAAIQAASRRVVLADHTKLGQRGLLRVATFSEVDLLITDRKPSADVVGNIASTRTRLLVADSENSGKLNVAV
jgi:DeoR/GlpR family transcriptional regulator of sugar metabolism